jgi:hypothetical protein
MLNPMQILAFVPWRDDLARGHRWREAELRKLVMGGQALGQKVVVFKASNDREIDAAQAKVSAMLVGGGAFLASRRRQIVGLAALHKIPAIYVTRQHTEAGGLMSYGASTAFSAFPSIRPISIFPA